MSKNFQRNLHDYYRFGVDPKYFVCTHGRIDEKLRSNTNSLVARKICCKSHYWLGYFFFLLLLFEQWMGNRRDITRTHYLLKVELWRFTPSI